MASRLVYERSGTAPVRASIDARGGELALFSAQDRKRILVAALRTGAEYYRQKYVPQLFTGRVYREPFNYQVKPRYAAKKARLGLPPLVGPDNPNQPRHLRDAALGDSYVTVDVSASRATMIIHIPGVQHVNANQMVLDVVRTLPKEWLADVAQVVANSIAALLAVSPADSANVRKVPQEVARGIGTLNRDQGWAGGAPRKIPGHG
jgi:hypothetical protein